MDVRNPIKLVSPNDVSPLVRLASKTFWHWMAFLHELVMCAGLLQLPDQLAATSRSVATPH